MIILIKVHDRIHPVVNGIIVVVLEYLKRKVIEWRLTNAEFVLNITLLLHFTTNHVLLCFRAKASNFWNIIHSCGRTNYV